jgi:hypothetical protein
MERALAAPIGVLVSLRQAAADEGGMGYTAQRLGD